MCKNVGPDLPTEVNDRSALDSVNYKLWNINPISSQGHTPPDPPAEVIHRPFWRSERAACADLHPDFAEEVLLHIASARGGNIWLRGTFERWKGFTRESESSNSFESQ